MNRKTIALALVFISFLSGIFAQEFAWKAGFSGFFDNREYFNPYSYPGSILGARSFAKAGFRIDPENEFFGGVDFMYEFGSTANPEHINPIIYYHHKNPVNELYMGAFPRYKLSQTPNIFLSDTVDYYRPNIEGVYLSFNTSRLGKHRFILDWTSRQTMEENEAFMITGSGTFGKGLLFANYHFMMYHHAGTAADGPSLIHDNGGFMFIPGINFSSLVSLDSLAFTTGFVGSYDRLRAFYSLNYSYGVLSEFYAQKKSLAIRSTMYYGDGHELMLGDHMYRAPVYNRTDFIYRVFRKGRVKGEFEFSFHFFPRITNFSQKFSVYIDIGGYKPIRREL